MVTLLRTLNNIPPSKLTRRNGTDARDTSRMLEQAPWSGFMEMRLADLRGDKFMKDFGWAYDIVSKPCPLTDRERVHGCPCAIMPGMTPAKLALMHDDEAAAKEIVLSGKEPTQQIECCGSLIGYSSTQGREAFTLWLLRAEETAAIRTPELIQAAPPHGQNALIKCCGNGIATCVRALLDLGADPHAADEDGFTPLMHAASAGQYETASMLLKELQHRGGEELAAGLKHANALGERAICHAALPSDEFGKTDARRMAIVRLFLDYVHKLDGTEHALDPFTQTCYRNGHACLEFTCSGQPRHDNTAGMGALDAESRRVLKAAADLCSHCSAPDATARCRGCHIARYCDAACQREHWKRGGHKRECAVMRLKSASGESGCLGEALGLD